MASDEQIIAAVREWGNHSATYVVRNRLGGTVKTAWVLRQLKRLEKAGLVRRAARQPYAVMICWEAV